jgi:hypothetical protein
MKEFAIKYTENFTEDIYDHLIKWCNDNIISDKIKWYSYFTDNSYKKFQNPEGIKAGWFRFTNKGDGDVGVDNNNQGSPEISLQKLCDMIGYTGKMSETELLKKAKKDYPVGTVFKGHIRKTIFVVKDNNYTFSAAGTGNILVSTDVGLSDIVKNGAAIYYEGKWAEIVSKPEIKEESQFIVGKWYKRTCSNLKPGYVTWLKCSSANPFKDSEHIFFEGTHVIEERKGRTRNNWKLLTDLSEIQQYLPEGHPDKFPVKQEEIKELPMNWVVKITDENRGVVKKWWESKKYGVRAWNIGAFYGMRHGDSYCYPELESNMTLITFDQFKKWVLKESDTLKVEDLVEGEIYSCNYSGVIGYVFKYSGEKSWYINPKSNNYSKATWAFWDNSDPNLRKATEEEKQWLEACIKAGKFVSLEDSKKVSDVSEYYECIQPSQFQNCIKINGGVIFHKDFDGYIGDPISNTAKNNPSSFKPSTKEAYDAQFVKTEEKWVPKVGDWAKCIGDSNITSGCSSAGWEKDLVFKITKLEPRIAFGAKDGNGVWIFESNLRKALPHEIPVEKEQSIEDILEEAKRWYPVGTKIKCILGWTEKNGELGITTNIPWVEKSNSRIWVGGNLYNLCIYDKDKWAEIVQSVEKPVSKNKTVKDWFNTLPPHLRDKAIEYCELDPLDYIITTECNSLDEALENAFAWENTDEGEDFWYGLTKLVTNKEDISTYGLGVNDQIENHIIDPYIVKVPKQWADNYLKAYIGIDPCFTPKTNEPIHIKRLETTTI